MSELLLVPVLSLHLICVNVASAGPLVCLWLEWKEAGGEALAGRLGRLLTWFSLGLLLAGALLGLLVGTLLWNDEYRQVLQLFPSKIYYAVWELLFSTVLILLHGIWWSVARQPGGRQRVVRALLPLLAGTNLLYHFPPLLVVISDVATGRTDVAGIVDAAAYRQMIVEGSVMARAVHVVIASFAMTGIWMIAVSLRWRAESAEPAESGEAARVARWGARLALVPTLLQVPVGLWVLAQLPQAAQHRLLGGDVLGSALLLLSVLTALWLLHELSAVAWGESDRATKGRAVASMVLVVVLMTGVLQRMT